jgi:hypothetical protein
MSIFGAAAGALSLSTKIHAGLAESGMLIGALACVAGGIAILSINIPFIGWAKKGIAYTLFGVAIFIGGHLEGYRARGTLDGSAELQRQLDQATADIKEKTRQANQASADLAAAGQRERDAADQSQGLAQQVSDYEKELASHPHNDACALSDADARWLSGIGAEPQRH